MPRTRHLRKNEKAAPVMRGLKPLRGYPKDDVFTTMEEIHAYLDGDKVACLLCGRQYAALGGHITRIHQMTSDDYRERFGIPYKFGLACKPFRDRSARHLKKLRREGRVPYQPTRETMDKMWKARRSRRPLTAATQQENRDKLLPHRGNRKTWHKADYEEFFRRVQSGRAPVAVGEDADMPTNGAYLRYLKKDSELEKRYWAYWDNLPFPEQVRFCHLGERYKHTLVKLRKRGNTWPEVAKLMDVSETAVRSMWYYMKRRNELKNYLNAA